MTNITQTPTPNPGRQHREVTSLSRKSRQRIPSEHSRYQEVFPRSALPEPLLSRPPASYLGTRSTPTFTCSISSPSSPVTSLSAPASPALAHRWLCLSFMSPPLSGCHQSRAPREGRLRMEQRDVGDKVQVLGAHGHHVLRIQGGIPSPPRTSAHPGVFHAQPREGTGTAMSRL